jgi:hypothetical protein
MPYRWLAARCNVVRSKSSGGGTRSTARSNDSTRASPTRVSRATMAAAAAGARRVWPSRVHVPRSSLPGPVNVPTTSS